MLAGALLAAAVQERGRRGRYEAYTEKASEGPKMKLAAATFFGGPGREEFIAAGTLSDGSIAAFGNAWGPEFPGSPVVLGRGRHRGLKPDAVDSKGKSVLRMENPDIAGMIVLYAADLSRILRAIRFDWGVASLSAGRAAPDGQGVLLAGRSTEAFRDAGPNVRRRPAPAVDSTPGGKKAPPATAGPYDYEGVPCTGDVFVARVSPEGSLEWAWVFEGMRRPPDRIWTDREGNVYADVGGLVRIARDGREARTVCSLTGSLTSRWLGVDPADGSAFFGGDRNTHTGKEPWRQPFLYKHGPDGTRLWSLWEWPPKSLRDDRTEGVQGLVSDSSVRALDVGPDGMLYVGGWSDGGNTVLTRQPLDPTRGVPRGGFSMDGSGMKGANSLAHVLRVNGSTREVLKYALWVSYFPANFADARKAGSPNGARIRQIAVCPNGAVAIAGSAASLLVQTPGAFYKPPGDGRGYGGDCVVVYDAELSTLLFSSYLPGAENAALWPTERGIVVVSRSRGDDGADPPTPSSVSRAVQPEKQGELDGHILLLEMP